MFLTAFLAPVSISISKAVISVSLKLKIGNLTVPIGIRLSHSRTWLELRVGISLKNDHINFF